MDLETIVTAILTKYASFQLDFSKVLHLDDCYKGLGDSVGHTSPQSCTSIELEGGLFSIEGIPILLMQTFDLRMQNADETEGLAKYSLILRAAEMLFSDKAIFPVLFFVWGGSDMFWDYMQIMQLGYNVGDSCNIYKKGHHSVATTISYISNDTCIAIAEEIIEDVFASLVVADAER